MNFGLISGFIEGLLFVRFALCFVPAALPLDLNLVVRDIPESLAFYKAAFPYWRIRSQGKAEWYGKERTFTLSTPMALK